MVSEAKTAEDLNELMMKSAMEWMLDTEMDVRLGRKGESDREPCEASTTEASALPEKARTNTGRIDAMVVPAK